MKKIIFVILLICSLIMPILEVVKTDDNIIGIILISFCSIYGLICMFFAENVCRFWNELDSIFYRASTDDDYDEPSTFGIIACKIAGFVFVFFRVCWFIADMTDI